MSETMSRALDNLDYGRKHTTTTLGRMAIYIAKGWLYCNQEVVTIWLLQKE